MSENVAYWLRADGSRQTMGTPAGAFSYAYDADGRMTGLTNPFGEASGWLYLDNGWLWTQTLGNGAVTTYTYNALGQTTDLVNRTGGGALLSEFATPNQGGYDTAGNATTFRGASRAFNADNQHTANTYDGDGNPTTYGGSALAFDPESRATAFGGALTVGYTGDGLRAWKQGSGGKTYFLYDGETPVCELNSSGTVTAVNTFGAAGLLSRRAGSSSTFYTFDPSGDVAQRLTSSAGAASSDTYDAFGGRQSTVGSDVFGYGGQWGYQTDAETGLVLCTHRYYDPQTGRWLTRDPMGYGGGVNLYGYVRNSPVNRADPSGLAMIGITIGIGAGGGLFGAGGGSGGSVEIAIDTTGTIAIIYQGHGLVTGPGFWAGPEGSIEFSLGDIGEPSVLLS